uniref:Uncharacterized protein n=1 Tax=Rhizophora mucronata TaxID=61149 RepID=A0A2P2MFK9_RHIMU
MTRYVSSRDNLRILMNLLRVRHFSTWILYLLLNLHVINIAFDIDGFLELLTYSVVPSLTKRLVLYPKTV